MKKLENAAMAAVAVIRSRLTTPWQSRYSSSAKQIGSSALLHTQVPPLSATMLAFTEMMYLSCASERTRGARKGGMRPTPWRRKWPSRHASQ